MDIKTSLLTAIELLKQHKIKFPHLDAEILLSHVIKKPREYLLTHPEKQLAKIQIANYKFQIAKRAKGKPVAYITGHKEFYGLDFYINKNVLIPRPETELMVDEALRITRNVERVTFIDAGTGSGCIIITLAKLLNRKSKIKNLKFFAADISEPALTIARKNAKLHNVYKKIKFLHGNLLKPIINNFSIRQSASRRSGQNSKFVITANLPYLTPAQIKNSPSIKHEPKLALSAGQDGLKYYRQLFKQINQCLMVNNQCLILIEIDPYQTIKIKQLIKKELAHSKIKIKKDLAGLNRLVIINITNDSE
ncbi:MAG: peptide chain release factor N(5)-glutamine methyltransferase [Patescibacteria group bacterium]|nr:peptide chain release factor N(5)-glutamine methyltransferase [Patescibacteria group bacterium]